MVPGNILLVDPAMILPMRPAIKRPGIANSARQINLEKKIGAKQGCLNPLPIFKPKGMHQKTWDRIRSEIQVLEHQGLMRIGQMMGMNV